MPEPTDVAGFAIAEYQKGGITYTWPDGPVGFGLALERLPERVRVGLEWLEATKRIFSYRSVQDFAPPFGRHPTTNTNDPTRVPAPGSPEALDRPLEPSASTEAVNLKIDCTVKWNGPLVQATFVSPPDGERARLGAEARVEIKRPTTEIHWAPTTPEWAALGISTYPVVEIPVSVNIDEPWPNDNLKVSFDLVLSGMYGFGDSAGGHYIKGGAAQVHKD